MDDKPDITRRDFLGGVTLGLAAGTSLTPLEILAAASPDYYPPALTGMRGNHRGSFEVAHALAWDGDLLRRLGGGDAHAHVLERGHCGLIRFFRRLVVVRAHQVNVLA